MDLNFGFLCSNLTTDADNHLNARQIGLSIVSATRVPTKIRGLFAVLSMNFGPSEISRKTLNVHVVDKGTSRE